MKQTRTTTWKSTCIVAVGALATFGCGAPSEPPIRTVTIEPTPAPPPSPPPRDVPPPNVTTEIITGPMPGAPTCWSDQPIPRKVACNGARTTGEPDTRPCPAADESATTPPPPPLPRGRWRRPVPPRPLPKRVCGQLNLHAEVACAWTVDEEPVGTNSRLTLNVRPGPHTVTCKREDGAHITVDIALSADMWLTIVVEEQE